MAITIGIVVLLIIIVAAFSGDNKQKVRQKEMEAIKAKIEAAYNDGSILEAHKDILLSKIQFDALYRLNIESKIQAFIFLKQHYEAIIRKYGDDIGGRLVNHQYWIGMTEEQLIDCKGRPTKVEKEVLKTKTKHTYIYGNKNSGDYFIIENGIVAKFVDR